jgi:hypothetical protein
MKRRVCRSTLEAAANWSYREQAHRQLIAALDLGGERSSALAQYEACRRLLMDELGCEPEDETRALYAQIRAGTLSPSWSRPPSFPAILTAASPAAPSSRFVAREQQLSRLNTFLDRALAGQGGMAIIVGEAGGGKTRCWRSSPGGPANAPHSPRCVGLQAHASVETTCFPRDPPGADQGH